MKPGLALSGAVVAALGVAAGACALGAGGVGVCASAGASNRKAAALIIRDRFSMMFSRSCAIENSHSGKTSRRPAVFLASPTGARGQNGFKSSIYGHNAVLQHDRRAADFRRRRPNRPRFRSARSRKCGKANGRTMIEPGVYRYPRMDRVAFGRPWEQVLAEEVERLGASRVFAIAGSTLAATVPLAAAMREALGERLAGFTHGIRAHTPRADVIG